MLRIDRHENVASHPVADPAPAAPPKHPPHRVPSITKRDREMLEIWSRGFENADVAKVLGISVETVKSGAQRVFRKLQAANRTEACVIALNLGHIKPRENLK